MNSRSLGHATMLAVAKRIVRLSAAGEADEAAQQYKARLTEMNDTEQQLFKRAVIAFAAEEQTS